MSKDQTMEQNWSCGNCGKEVAIEQKTCPFCGAFRDPLKGRVLAGTYRLVRRLSEGAMGEVYLATHIHFQGHRAIKILRNESLRDESRRKRFLREIKVTYELSQKTEHIVSIHDQYGFEGELGYYVMEYLEGDLLEQRIAQAPKGLPLTFCLDVALQLCEAMEVVHAEGVIHRDLKPANIFLIEHKQRADFVKLLDFGIAKVSDEHSQLTGPRVIPGTPMYMSPEQIKDALYSGPEAQQPSLDGRADIYSLGCILFELLTGRPPFFVDVLSPMSTHALLVKHLQEPAPSIRSLNPAIPEILERILDRTLQKDPDDRFGSMADLSVHLRKVLVSLGSELPFPPDGGVLGESTLPETTGLKSGVVEGVEAPVLVSLPEEVLEQPDHIPDILDLDGAQEAVSPVPSFVAVSSSDALASVGSLSEIPPERPLLSSMDEDFTSLSPSPLGGPMDFDDQTTVTPQDHQMGFSSVDDVIVLTTKSPKKPMSEVSVEEETEPEGLVFEQTVSDGVVLRKGLFRGWGFFVCLLVLFGAGMLFLRVGSKGGAVNGVDTRRALPPVRVDLKEPPRKSVGEPVVARTERLRAPEKVRVERVAGGDAGLSVERFVERGPAARLPAVQSPAARSRRALKRKVRVRRKIANGRRLRFSLPPGFLGTFRIRIQGVGLVTKRNLILPSRWKRWALQISVTHHSRRYWPCSFLVSPKVTFVRLKSLRLRGRKQPSLRDYCLRK